MLLYHVKKAPNLGCFFYAQKAESEWFTNLVIITWLLIMSVRYAYSPYDLVAQWIEQLPTKQWGKRSSRFKVTRSSRKELAH